MKKVLNIAIFFIISFFLITTTTKAADSCTYKEQQALNKEAKNININYELVNKLDEAPKDQIISTRDYYYLQVTIVNLTDDFNIKITNNIDNEEKNFYSSDAVDNVISFKNEYSDAQTENCTKTINTKSLTVPKFNTFYKSGLCVDIPEYKYCQELISTNLDDNKIGSAITKYYNQVNSEKSETDTSKKSILPKILLYCGIGIGSAIIIGLIVYLISKKVKKGSKL
jgi:hypothetical protein